MTMLRCSTCGAPAPNELPDGTELCDACLEYQERGEAGWTDDGSPSEERAERALDREANAAADDEERDDG